MGRGRVRRLAGPPGSPVRAARRRDPGRHYADRRQVAARAVRQRFADIWNAAPDVATAAKRLGLEIAAARTRAVRLRRSGKVKLRYFPRLTTKQCAMERLLRAGWAVPEVARSVGAHTAHVYRFAAQLRRLRSA